MPRRSPVASARAAVRRAFQRAAGVDALMDQMTAALTQLDTWRRGRQLAAIAAWGEAAEGAATDPRCTVLSQPGAAGTPYVAVVPKGHRLHPAWLPLACAVLDQYPEMVAVYGEHVEAAGGVLVWSLADEGAVSGEGAAQLAVSALVARSAVAPADVADHAAYVRAVAHAGTVRALPVPASRH